MIKVYFTKIFSSVRKEFSAYNFEYANTDNLFKMFDMLEDEAKSLTEKNFLYLHMINV